MGFSTTLWGWVGWQYLSKATRGETYKITKFSFLIYALWKCKTINILSVLVNMCHAGYSRLWSHETGISGIVAKSFGKRKSLTKLFWTYVHITLFISISRSYPYLFPRGIVLLLIFTLYMINYLYKECSKFLYSTLWNCTFKQFFFFRVGFSRQLLASLLRF